MFSFPVKTEDEVMREGLLPKGDYQFCVKSCKTRNSKAGNPMLEVILIVYDAEGHEHFVYDYLSSDFMPFKLRHFFVNLGMEDAYNKGAIDPESCVGKSGIVKLFVKEDKSGQYAPKNAVQDYLKPETAQSVFNVTSKGIDQEMNDDIPF